MRHFHAFLVVGGLTITAFQDADALSFGRVRSNPIIGQTLSVAVPIALAPGDDEITEECVRAVVVHGETTLPPNAVRARMTGGGDDATRVVRISTTIAVDEPVVTVTLSAGCPTRLSRSFTLLADPPTTLARTAPAEAPVAPAPQPQARAAEAAEGAGTVSAPAPRPAPRREREAPVRRAPVAAAPKPAADVVPTTTAADTTAPRAVAPKARAPEPARPRLQLESSSVAAPAAPPVTVPDPAAAAAMATAEAAKAEALAAEQRAKALEAEVERMKAAAKDQADSIIKLQAKVAQGQLGNEWSQWLPWVAGLAGLSTLLAMWLAHRVRRLSIEAQRNAWWMRENQSSLLQSRVTEVEREEPPPPAAIIVRPSRQDAPPVVAPPTTMLSPPSRSFVPSTVNVSPETMPAPVGAQHASMSRQASRSVPSEMQVDTHRAVSVDEQIDLEQQADFFIALGHDDAAIDLLLAHLRNTGGAAPIPYLKLLEVYRRRGDHDDYEVMRRRFNQRFNSVAPEWGQYGEAGRALVEYPAQVARLEAVWRTPLDAMAELEAMAFGRGNEQELFDLPAYQDVLFLYQLARQLHEDSAQGKGTGVDVLLPLGGETGPAPLMTTLTDTTVNSTIMGGLDLDISSQRAELAPPAESGLRPMPLIDLDLPKRPKLRP